MGQTIGEVNMAKNLFISTIGVCHKFTDIAKDRGQWTQQESFPHINVLERKLRSWHY